uniref:Cilia- and flagella-associated protein 45 n=1 Tax=Polytomella parva TaxID=51329 RepID=A0A7S0VDS1_9CHLO|mmetsp:Transcript_33766/g.60961  ORF Transcript_33766/g.60961 Transcript_33766/m.60961 type:complete len:493 (+) Transcript_33766:251-1729(+)|eukprot:CAMPEP_0175052592 /NCGR_PEP_ID=MMETSP0052_2-20121109/8446_1 /TAXON_ID=51329 ORGANISM="Polytomella parva, Strain SAG 63-3" /NCGR_SAMPLE_ID=MMETSP0052_2 /ASSEMBLY_ACC=CAM_ASM_000194 /LENGTH=492 /DNA_ID=CAMNT_0016317015 /DNA_START=192 /DNA_END=1673 /DNA_ORIENTATION=-
MNSRKNKGSEVDESLFGSRNASKKGTAKKALSDATATQSKLTQIEKDAISLTRRDFERMLKPTPIMTSEDIAFAKREAQANRDKLQAVSKARKEKMMKLEEEAKKQIPMTETELIKRQTDDSTRSRAQNLMMEQKDDVKRMNQMILYSKCVTIRDAQIEEKKQMLLESEEEQRRLDVMMEVERIKALDQYSERERQRHEERLKGARVLEEQIRDRQRERIRQEELRDQERIQLLREMERMKEEEMQVTIEKKIQAKTLMEEVATANADQIKRKEVMKLHEKEEERKIAEYILQKDLRERALLAEKERLAKEKELETARLRAMQERAADKQAELDEIRARRYQEAKEREWRMKEKATAERQQAMQQELSEARSAQQNAKLKQKAEMARLEKEEFERIILVNKSKAEDDLQLTKMQQNLNSKYKDDLQTQIQTNEEQRRRQRQQQLEEGVRQRVALEREKQLLLGIKSKKLSDLETMGVPAKYRAELEKMKIKV